jgi:hypothetical protein
MEDRLKVILRREHRLDLNIKLKPHIRVGPAPLRIVANLPDIAAHGSMTSQLRLRIRNTLANARSTLKHSRNPHPVNISAGGNPPTHTCFIFVSIHESDTERGSDVILSLKWSP